MEQISASFELISHPDRTLQEHLDSCNEISQKLLDMKFISSSFFLKDEIEQFRKLLVYFHDFGKGTDFFQSKIIDATLVENISDFVLKHQAYLDYFEKNKARTVRRALQEDDTLSNHAMLGAYLVFSCFSNKNVIIEYIIHHVIKRHHGYLRNFVSNKKELLLDKYLVENIEKQLEHFNWESYQKILNQHNDLTISKEKWELIKKRFSDPLNIDNIRYDLKNEVKKNQIQASKYFFLQHYLFSLLLSADKGDMMVGKSVNKWNILTENKLFNPNIINSYKERTLKKGEKLIDVDRENAYQEIAKNVREFSSCNFFSITLPTGMGKTFSAYNAAIILQNEFGEFADNKKPRVIYCLPFTSIIDQNSAIFSDIVASFQHFDNQLTQDMVAKHHYLSNYNERYNDVEIGANESEYLTEGWEQEFIVTTFVQLLESIFTNQNRALRKFHNITNAIIVLDEVQNIPPKYYEAIEFVFTKLAEYFSTKFIFVTATQPILFSKTNVIELTDISKEKTRAYFEKLERIVIDQSILKSNSYQPQDLEKDLLPIFCSDIEENQEKSFLFILNTIAQSQFVFSTFQKLYAEDCQVIYLSGSILPKRRKQLIQLIKRNIKYKKRQIIVSTQVVEAGVDIDLDIVYRDFSPLDSINQSAGRCNRNGLKGQGIVKLFNTGKHKNIYDSTLMSITETIFKNKEAIIPESEIYNLSNKYFEEIKESISKDSNASSTLINAILHLELETVHKEFKLIKDDNYYYNVFIPYNQDSERIWSKYTAINQIEDFFEKKQAIKKIKPRLLQYITRFPKKKYDVDVHQKESFIIYEPDWAIYYDLNAGFKLDIKEDTFMCL
ncbi:MAG: CRISPR-associated helicase Cas3' [Flavobacterium sp.]